jgi:hypothetical protein
MRRAGTLLAGILIGIAALGAQAIDATGVWVATDVPFAPWTVKLKQDGTKLTGTMEQNGGLPGTVNIYEGSIDSSAISFKADSPDGARAITFTGKINGDEITLNRSTRIVTDKSQGGNGLFGTKAAPQFTIRRGAPAAAELFSYKGMEIEVSAIRSAPNREAILDALRRQIDIVDAAITDPAQKAFVKSVRLTMGASPGTTTDLARYSSKTKGVEFQSWSYGPKNPVLLHELMHAYHDQKLPNGFGNADILNLYQQARTGGRFPEKSYMLSRNVNEYFAMMASVYLHGSAARDPFTREAIKEKQPDCYQWLVKEFGPR